MQRLLYVSDVSILGASTLPSTVEDILVVSVPSNRRDGVTGFLLCDGVCFAQVLEGGARAVGDCFARIARDDRHVNIEVLLREQTASRSFPRWSMCGLTLSQRDDDLLHPSATVFDFRKASPYATLQHLQGIAVRNGAELDQLHEALLARFSPL
jgi:hypothetical protein